jgi:hypothetical protein
MFTLLRMHMTQTTDTDRVHFKNAVNSICDEMSSAILVLLKRTSTTVVESSW